MDIRHAIFEFLNGKRYTLDGISGHFKYRTYEAIYPSRRTVHKLSHEADARGRRSERYQETKRKLQDDWSTDLTDSIERYCDIAHKLGFESSPETA
jgi:hypothetical protein